MYTLIREGGASMMFVLAFGFVTLATAFWFAIRPTPQQVGFIRWMSRATLFTILCATCVCFSITFHAVTSEELPNDLFARIIVRGAAESLAPGIIGFALLSLTSLATAIGQRKLDARKS
jgi:hypothetical protein